MNIQIYYLKKNFDYQKAERYFKERRIPFQGLDLKKHRLGDREIRMMLEAFGMDKLLDREDKKVRETIDFLLNREEAHNAMFQEAFNKVQRTGSNRDFGTTKAAKMYFSMSEPSPGGNEFSDTKTNPVSFK